MDYNERLQRIVQGKRSDYWDTVKGILIALVVFAHFLYDLQNTSSVINAIVDGIYLFHMPAFVFVSGYFSKSENSRSKPNLLRLCAAYLLLHGWFMLFSFQPVANLRFFNSYHSEWYLVALAWWRLSVKYLPEKKNVILISFIVAVCAGFFTNVGGCEFLAFNKTITFFPFFIMGYKFTSERLAVIRSKKAITKLATSVFLVLIACAGWVVDIFVIHVSDTNLTASVFQPPVVLELIGRVIGFVVAANAIALLLLLPVSHKVPFLTMAGRNSLVIYIVHRPITLLYASFVAGLPVAFQLIFAGAMTVLVIVMCGTTLITKYVNAVINAIAKILIGETKLSLRCAESRGRKL